jgi:poly(A) polymerase
MPERPQNKKNPKGRHSYAAREHGIHRGDISAFALEVVEILQSHQFEAYIVGGSVRDLLLGLHPKDYDVATNATPEQITRCLPRTRIIGRRFRIVHARKGREVIEVTTFRGHHNSKSGKGRHAEQTKSGLLIRDNVYGSLEEDAKRRDFSCNSLYYDPVSGQLLDYCNGLEDIRNGTLHTIGDPYERFREDPVRMLRAVRFEAKLGLKLDEESREALRANRQMMQEVAPARLFDEVIKILLTPYATKAYQDLIDTGLFSELFPSTSEVLALPTTSKLLTAAMQNTEQRLADDKGVAPFFLYAVLLWPAVKSQYEQLIERGFLPDEAMSQAGRWVLERQNARIVIPKRFAMPMADMWQLQIRLLDRTPKKAARVASLSKFRAAYDLLILRELAGESLGDSGQWWTQYQETRHQETKSPEQRTEDTGHKTQPRRRRRRKPRNKGSDS